MHNHPSYIGVVIGAGKCLKSVKVRVAKQVWHKKLRKHYTEHKHHLCDDFLGACVPGDVVRIAAGYQSSAQKRHIVDALVSPMHTGAERIQPEGVTGWLRRHEEKRFAKLLRLPGVEAVDVVEQREGEGDKQESPAVLARRRMRAERAGSKGTGILGEVLLGKRVGVRVHHDGRKLMDGTRLGPGEVKAGMWKGLWRGLQVRERQRARKREENVEVEGKEKTRQTASVAADAA